MDGLKEPFDIISFKKDVRKMTKELKEKMQCKYCIYTIEPCRMARHIGTRHPEKVEEWIHAED